MGRKKGVSVLAKINDKGKEPLCLFFPCMLDDRKDTWVLDSWDAIEKRGQGMSKRNQFDHVLHCAKSRILWEMFSLFGVVWVLHSTVREALLNWWEATWGKALTLDQLQKRGWPLANRCYLCKRHEESIDLILLHCAKARTLWTLLCSLFGMQWVLPATVKVTLLGWDGIFGSLCVIKPVKMPILTLSPEYAYNIPYISLVLFEISPQLEPKVTKLVEWQLRVCLHEGFQGSGAPCGTGHTDMAVGARKWVWPLVWSNQWLYWLVTLTPISPAIWREVERGGFMDSGKESDSAADTPTSPKNVYKDPDDGRQRFLLELEFVQCLANPTYIHYLAQNRYFEDEAFIGYLKYLQYWQQPEYIKFIMYPHCLFFLNFFRMQTSAMQWLILEARKESGWWRGGGGFGSQRYAYLMRDVRNFAGRIGCKSRVDWWGRKSGGGFP
ncbi:Mediator of RNA polymerase II transcription subunit 31 [Vitis vinifera]|uniref:Mediator of RNA polymerase II transcription subunit 31 n=1 Tax=Vitis vinifera TaxID=29760 RepID=A0A438IYK0_VITVI|nr:Mediator of RNA polymerase II transcription subunit 31 [Vitis vinifera]